MKFQDRAECGNIITLTVATPFVLEPSATPAQCMHFTLTKMANYHMITLISGNLNVLLNVDEFCFSFLKILKYF